MSAPPALANVLRPHGEFAIIGPGGGVDVLRAVANGSPSVTGIEINPIIANTIMRGRYADYSLHLYDRPDVHSMSPTAAPTCAPLRKLLMSCR